MENPLLFCFEGRRTRHREGKTRLVLYFRGIGFDLLFVKELMVKELTEALCTMALYINPRIRDSGFHWIDNRPAD